MIDVREKKDRDALNGVTCVTLREVATYLTYLTFDLSYQLLIKYLKFTTKITISFSSLADQP